MISSRFTANRRPFLPTPEKEPLRRTPGVPFPRDSTFDVSGYWVEGEECFWDLRGPPCMTVLDKVREARSPIFLQ